MKIIVRNYIFIFIVLLISPSLLWAEEKPGKAAIASAHTLATDAGFEILAAGGNAFDAAIAVSSTLAVVEPGSSGIGGGAFWLLHRASDGKEIMVDARETAPAAANGNLYLDNKGDLDKDKSINGPLAAAIPGEPAGLVWLAQHYGKLPLSKSLAPAIRIARNGFKPDVKFLSSLSYRKEVILRYPASAALFLENGEVPKAGWTFKSLDLARTLELIAEKGFDGFYRGETAEKLLKGVKENGGNWVTEDLTSYQVKERPPLTFDYRGYRITTAPPPSSGGVALAEMLNVLSGYDLDKLNRVSRVHLIIEAMRRAYRDRGDYMGDPDFVKMPIDMLMNPIYAAGLRASIRTDKATPSAMLPGIEATPAGTHTTHFSLIDAEGNRVAATLTVNLPYGCAFIAPGTGFVLNNELDDFALKAGAPNAYGLIGNDANSIQPNKRPLSSMTPTFVVGKDKLAVLGTPGGSRIITMVLEGILAFIDGELPEKIVANHRFHHQYLPDVVSAEPGTFTREESKALQAMGHTINDSEQTWGFMNMVSWDKKTGKFSGGSDPRGASGSAMVK